MGREQRLHGLHIRDSVRTVVVGTVGAFYHFMISQVTALATCCPRFCPMTLQGLPDNMTFENLPFNGTDPISTP